MGLHTTWHMGYEQEARLLWERRFPRERLRISTKFILRNELWILRCLLHGCAELDPAIEIYQHAFPRSSDPEHQEWYLNIEEDFAKSIEWVLPEFLQELQAIQPHEIEILASTWGAKVGEWWHQKWPEHAVDSLRQYHHFARMAVAQGMGGLATESF